MKELRDDCLQAKVKWNKKWTTFIDSMTFCDVSTSAKRDLLVPTEIRKLIINPKLQFEILEKVEKNDENETLVDVVVCPYLKIIKAGGGELNFE